MTARRTIEKMEIVDAALELVREAGWEAVSARKLAFRLDTSTMPIYSTIGSMEELKRATLDRSIALLEAAQHEPRTGNDALDMAVGYVLFARDESRVFDFIVANQSDGEQAIERMTSDPGYEDRFDPNSEIREVLRQLRSPGQRTDFVFRSWVFAYGLAALVSGGHVRMEESEIVRHLEAAGGAFYLFEKKDKEGR